MDGSRLLCLYGMVIKSEEEGGSVAQHEGGAYDISETLEDPVSGASYPAAAPYLQAALPQLNHRLPEVSSRGTPTSTGLEFEYLLLNSKRLLICLFVGTGSLCSLD